MKPIDDVPRAPRGPATTRADGKPTVDYLPWATISELHRAVEAKVERVATERRVSLAAAAQIVLEEM